MPYYVDMYISRAPWPSSNGKTYQSIYLRESYRDGDHVRKRDIANLTHCDPQEIAAIELALSSRATWRRSARSTKSSCPKGLRSEPCGSSRKPPGASASTKRSAVDSPANWRCGRWWHGCWSRARAYRRCAWRKCMRPAMCSASGAASTRTISIRNLTWLSEHQEAIEKRLFAERRGQQKPELFLYDVTSSYLEGEDNAYAAYGYNRDGKKGKKQIVIGLLCDEQGTPVSTEVFRGNTQDPKTFAAQVQKASERFGCERVTFVGDRGMIKSGQVEDLSQAGFHYITAITKPQIDTLIEARLIQMELFAAEVCEVEREGVRYVLRRNPIRAEQLAASRADKQATVEQLRQDRNRYLDKHPRAKVATAEKALRAKIAATEDPRLASGGGGRAHLEANGEPTGSGRSLAAGRLLRHQDRSAGKRCLQAGHS